MVGNKRPVIYDYRDIKEMVIYPEPGIYLRITLVDGSVIKVPTDNIINAIHVDDDVYTINRRWLDYMNEK